jgi:hypothetical protein
MKDDIYINPKVSKKGGWTSFESDPHLKKTRKSIHRGCADPYEKLLGPWKTWQRRTPIRSEDNLKMVIHQLERLLR